MGFSKTLTAQRRRHWLWKRFNRRRVSTVSDLLEVYSPTSGVGVSIPDNWIDIRDPITSANNFSGPLIDPATSLCNKLTFLRAGVAYIPDGNGGWLQVAANTPRICDMPYGRVLLIEGSGLNLIASPLAPATQGVTVTAVAHTLSFTGTGTIALSGASTAGPLVGTGASNRVALTFTPSAGTLTLTITGDVRFAQCEARAFVSSFMNGSRSAETCSLPGTAFNLTQAAGTLYVRNSWDGGTTIAASQRGVATLDNGTLNEYVGLYNGAPQVTQRVVDGGVAQAQSVSSANIPDGVLSKVAATYALNDFAVSVDGATPIVDAAGTLPTTTNLTIGRLVVSGLELYGGISEFAFFGSRISNSNLQAMTA